MSKKDLTIFQIEEYKRKAEEDIVNILERLEDQTGIGNFTLHDTTTKVIDEDWFIHSVRIEIRL